MKTNRWALLAAIALLPFAAASADVEKDKADIRAVLDAGCKGFVAGSLDGSMGPYAKNAFIFDLTPKLHSTYDDVKEGNQKLLNAFETLPTCDYKDMVIEVDHNHAYAHYLLPFSATLKGGKKLDVLERVLDVFERKNGKWLIVVEHDSVPVDVVAEKIYTHAAE